RCDSYRYAQQTGKGCPLLRLPGRQSSAKDLPARPWSWMIGTAASPPCRASPPRHSFPDAGRGFVFLLLLEALDRRIDPLGENLLQSLEVTLLDQGIDCLALGIERNEVTRQIQVFANGMDIFNEKALRTGMDLFAFAHIRTSNGVAKILCGAPWSSH